MQKTKCYNTGGKAQTEHTVIARRTEHLDYCVNGVFHFQWCITSNVCRYKWRL